MMKITQLSQLDSEATYSYADYLTWQLDKAVELIRGKVMLMSPAPNVKHQSIVTNLGGVLYQFFYKKPCKLFYAPFDVRLYDQHKSIKADQDIYTVVQPDLSVICDPEKLTEQGCLGAPDWIIEILSPGNSKKEMQIKYALYQESGVKEYWMVYPYEKAVHQFMLDVETEKYQLIAMFAEEDYASPQGFPDLKID
ncbi:restriction endonuclease, partial [Methylococcaceae bacterium HT4]